MSVTHSSRLLFLIAGAYAALCAPTILFVERLGWPQGPFHVTQLLAAMLCFPASLVFLWRTRGAPFGAQRWLAVVAAVLTGLWIAFVIYVVLTLDFSAMDR